jgi:hypothetical protein
MALLKTAMGRVSGDPSYQSHKRSKAVTKLD